MSEIRTPGPEAVSPTQASAARLTAIAARLAWTEARYDTPAFNDWTWRDLYDAGQDAYRGDAPADIAWLLAQIDTLRQELLEAQASLRQAIADVAELDDERAKFKQERDDAKDTAKRADNARWAAEARARRLEAALRRIAAYENFPQAIATEALTAQEPVK